MTSTPQTTRAERNRLARATSLGGELLELMRRMAEGVSGPDAVVFLDRLTRCAAFSADELEQAGVADIVDQARELHATDGALLAQLASRSLDLEGLRQRAYAAAAGGDEDVLSLAMDALLAGVVSESLPADARERATAICEEVVAIVAGSPAVFEEAVVVAIDRIRHERPSRLPAPARELVGVLRAAPRLAAEDEEHEGDQVPDEAREQVQAAMGRLEQPTTGATCPVVGSRSWRDHLREMFAAALSAPAPSTSYVFAAASADTEQDMDSELLRSLPDGKVFLVRRGRELHLEWQGSREAPTAMWANDDETCEMLEPSPAGDGVKWRLDPSMRSGELILRFGANTVRIPLPS